MEENLLVASDTYKESGIQLGTKFKTKYMKEFIYRVRPDGLPILNISQIDERLRTVSKILSAYEPKDIMIVSARDAAYKPIKIFSKLTGINNTIGRYPPGSLTNPNLRKYKEAKVLLIIDPIVDKNAMEDAHRAGNILIISLCDTNNTSLKLDFSLPANNRGKKSLGLIFWILAREYLTITGKIKEKEFKAKLEDFCEE